MDETLRLAIIGINYAPEEIGIARYTTAMAVALAKRGHQVEVVAGQPYYPAWKVAPKWRGGWRTTVESGVTITRCPHYVPANPTGLRRILHLASCALSALAPTVRIALRGRQRRPQVVLCIAPALLSVPVAWIAARLAGAMLWVHIQDFEVEAAFATGLLNGNGRMARLIAALEQRVLRLADVVSSISPPMCAKLVQKGLDPQRVVEIRNWADNDAAFTETNLSPYRAEWQLGERHVCLYSGNIANKQGLEILVDAARLLHHRRDLTFVICGEGPNRAHLETLASGLDNIQFHNLQPMARIGDLLGLANIHLLPQIPGAADLVLPSKLTNMLASGRPVVATAEHGTGLHREVDGCGIIVKPGDPQALADAIFSLVNQPDLAAQLGANALQRARDRWSQDGVINRLEVRLRSLVSHGRIEP